MGTEANHSTVISADVVPHAAGNPVSETGALHVTASSQAADVIGYAAFVALQ